VVFIAASVLKPLTTTYRMGTKVMPAMTTAAM
jgi:hypothetical protein